MRVSKKFVNNDSRSHEMFSDPHPEHTDCPEINQVGFLSPGQSPADRQPHDGRDLRLPRSQPAICDVSAGEHYY